MTEEEKMLKIFKAQVEKEEQEYFWVNNYTQLVYSSHRTALNLIEKQQKEIENLKELRNKIEKEYNCALEGFMKKQIPTSVVDGTIAQETGWILNEIDKILNDGGENK